MTSEALSLIDEMAIRIASLIEFATNPHAGLVIRKIDPNPDLNPLPAFDPRLTISPVCQSIRENSQRPGIPESLPCLAAPIRIL